MRSKFWQDKYAGTTQGAMTAWNLENQLKEYSKQLKKLRQEETKARDKRYENEISEYWKQRKMFRVWQAAGLLTGAKAGAKRKWGKCPLSCQPNRQQTFEALRRPPEEGGWQAELLFDQVVEEAKESKVVETMVDLAKQDDSNKTDQMFSWTEAAEFVGELKLQATKLKNRKYTPATDIPAELWKVLMRPERVYAKSYEIKQSQIEKLKFVPAEELEGNGAVSTVQPPRCKQMPSVQALGERYGRGFRLLCKLHKEAAEDILVLAQARPPILNRKKIVKFKLGADFDWMLQAIVQTSFMTVQLPVQMCIAQTFRVPKKFVSIDKHEDAQVMLSAARLVFAYGALTKMFVKTLDARKPIQRDPGSSQYGAIRGRSRTHALEVQQVTRERLRMM